MSRNKDWFTSIDSDFKCSVRLGNNCRLNVVGKTSQKKKLACPLLVSELIEEENSCCMNFVPYVMKLESEGSLQLLLHLNKMGGYEEKQNTDEYGTVHDGR